MKKKNGSFSGDGGKSPTVAKVFPIKWKNVLEFFFLLSSFFFNSPLPFAQVSGRILGRPATRRGSPISATGGAPQWSLFISFPRQQESYELKKERKRERERERENRDERGWKEKWEE